ncbi:MAG TPA: hypothetical protein DCG49_09425 [Ruminococcus sp.]|nr:hypothetical protein [Ruminococcus sp.]
MGRNKKLQEIDLSLNSLVVFRKLLTHEVILPLRALLDTESMDPMIQLRQYTEFISRLYARSTNLTEYVFRLICEDDNFYVRAVASGAEVDPMLEACVQNELAILQRLARIRPHELQKEVSYYGVLPEWKTSDLDFGAEFHARLREIGKYGYGKFADSSMFVIRDEQCRPVLHPDPIQLGDLIGYTAQRQAVIENTRVLLAGKPAQDVLLYGASGTGKSVTVKALANAFFSEGLRLIKVTREQLPMLPELMEQVFDNPLKFIFYVDDLDLSAADSSMTVLRSVLEGALSARAQNTAIYAVSSTSADPEQTDGLHALTERFGLRVHFGMPDKTAYLQTVSAMAEQAHLRTAPEAIEAMAGVYADQRGNFSPRTAKQFIRQLSAKSAAE